MGDHEGVDDRGGDRGNRRPDRLSFVVVHAGRPFDDEVFVIYGVYDWLTVKLAVRRDAKITGGSQRSSVSDGAHSGRRVTAAELASLALVCGGSGLRVVAVAGLVRVSSASCVPA